MSIIDPNSPGLFSFFAPKAGGPGTYQGMEARRRIALQLLANSRKGYPKNIGEGLTAIGDAIGDRAVLNQLAEQESAYQKQAMAGIAGAIPAEARGSEPASTIAPETRTPGPQSALSPAIAPPPLATSELTPDERAAGVIGSEANALDAAAPPVATAAATTAGYRPAPPYLRAALEQNIADPERRGYLGQLAGKEARSANEVSSTGASGPFQFTRGTGRQYGLIGPGGDRRNDIAASIAAVNRFTDDNVATLTARLGRPPTPGEMALAHQQGAVTAARMLSGAGNASPGNLAVNNVSPGASPQAAAARIMAYYGMPGGGGGGTAPQTAQMTPSAAPLTAADAAGIDRLGDVTGMGAGDRGYSYPPTASLGRAGDVQSDAPPLAGISPTVGAAAADTVQQNRDAIARARLPGMLPPAPRPTGPGGPTANVVSDITPAPPVAGTQLAQATPPGGLPPVRAPLTGLPQREVPPPITPEPPSGREALPERTRMGDDEKRGYRIRAEGQAMGDPGRTQMGQGLIDIGVADRQQRDAALMQDYRDRLLARRTKEQADEAFNRAAPERELTRQQAEVALAKSKQFGGLSEGAVLKPVEDSSKAVAGIPQGQVAVRNALRLVPDIFTGASADAELSTKKLIASLGFPADPRISATEQFKAYIMPALAAARQAQSGGANISDNDMLLAAKAVAGDIKLSRDSIQKVLEELQRVNVKAAIWHQSKVEAAAGDDPQRQAFMLRAYGLPMHELVDPRAIADLRTDPSLADDFNRKYHSPGLAQQILGGR